MSGDQDNPTDTNGNKESTGDVIHVRPKSKKELRAEKKALKKAQAAKPSVKPTADLTREEKKALRKKSKKAMLKDQRLQTLKEQRIEKKLRKQKRLRREMNAPGGVNAVQQKKANSKKNKMKEVSDQVDSSKEKKSNGNDDYTMNIYNNLFNGTTDETTGTTTLRMGVKYIDIVEGTGQPAQERNLVNVSYKLKGGKYGAIIDSSKNFSFRLGKGEVIKGWEIGVEGMKVGGRRHLIVPPKAGYGPQDIGAGPGATLFFDITLLSMR
jgi:FKBP-type peptidyl-prolyl cis-trans isomerase